MQEKLENDIFSKFEVFKWEINKYLPLSSSQAVMASSGDSKLTKPNPLDLPSSDFMICKKNKVNHY